MVKLALNLSSDFNSWAPTRLIVEIINRQKNNFFILIDLWLIIPLSYRE
jgi:hypothetical protein